MLMYSNFKRCALTAYKVAVGVYGYSDDFSVVLDGRSYIDAHLRGVVEGLILAQVATSAEVRACYDYVRIVSKAYTRHYIDPKLGRKR